MSAQRTRCPRAGSTTAASADTRSGSDEPENSLRCVRTRVRVTVCGSVSRTDNFLIQNSSVFAANRPQSCSCRSIARPRALRCASLFLRLYLSLRLCVSVSLSFSVSVSLSLPPSLSVCLSLSLSLSLSAYPRVTCISAGAGSTPRTSELTLRVCVTRHRPLSWL